jgi:hypothetical protein
MGGWLAGTSLSVVKAWLAGVQPYLYCLLLSRFFAGTAAGWRVRSARLALVGAGLTFFGVTAAHHILRKSDLKDEQVWRLSLAGPFLNVPYRIALSAVLLNAVLHLAKPLTS